MIVIDSKADHLKVAREHPEWDIFDWCRYWELDVRKGWKKSGRPDPKDRIMDCGEDCKCKTLK